MCLYCWPWWDKGYFVSLECHMKLQGHHNRISETRLHLTHSPKVILSEGKETEVDRIFMTLLSALLWYEWCRILLSLAQNSQFIELINERKDLKWKHYNGEGLQTTNDHQKRKESPLQQSKRAIIHHLMTKIRRALLFLSAPRQYQELQKNRQII